MKKLQQKVAKKLKISKDFSVTLKHGWTYMSSSLARKGLKIIGTPIMTRLLTPEDYGILNVFGIYVVLCASLFTFNLHVGVERYYYEKKTDFSSFLGTVMIICVFCLLLAEVAFLVWTDSVANLLELPKFAVYFLVPLAFREMLKGVHQQYYRARRESKKIRSLSIYSGYVGFFLGVALVYFHEIDGRWEGKLWAGIIMTVATSAFILYRLWNKFKVDVKWDHIKYMFSYGFPLLPSYLSSYILSQFDRVMIGHYVNKGEVGQYSFAYNISMLLTMFMAALYNSWIPKYYEYMRNEDYESHDRDTTKLLAIFSFVTCGLMLFADWVGYIFGSKAFHTSLYLIPLIVIGQFVIGIIPIYKRHISFVKKNLYTSATVLIAGVLNIVLNAWLIPKYGSIAAAFTTVISYIALFGMTFIVVKYFLKTYTTPLIIVIRNSMIVMIACSFYYINLYYLDLSLILDIVAKFAVLFFCLVLLFWSYFKPILIPTK